MYNMDEQILFLNMFPDYAPPELLFGSLSQAAVVAADIFSDERKVFVELHCPQYISRRMLDGVASDICDIYGLNDLSLCVVFPEDQLAVIEPDEVMDLFVRENSMNRGSLAGAKWNWNGSDLSIQLLGNGKKELQECVKKVEMTLSERFSTPVSIQIEAGQDLQGKDLFEAMEKLRSEMIQQMPVSHSAEEKQVAAPAASDTIYGKSFKGTTIPMKDIDLNMGNVIVEGKVFAIDHKDLPKRNAVIVKFDLSCFSSRAIVNLNSVP